MPTKTFFNLSQEKRDKIIKAAKKEYSRVPLQETSIQNIVIEANIARGSFYQYFDDKIDLLEYILDNIIQKIIDKTIKKLKESDDIFKTYIYMYDQIMNSLVDEENKKFCQMIFKNLKMDDFIFEKIKNHIIKDNMTKLSKLVMYKNLKYNNESDLRLILKMLNCITIRRIDISIQSDENERNKLRNEYIRQLEFIKYGIAKI